MLSDILPYHYSRRNIFQFCINVISRPASALQISMKTLPNCHTSYSASPRFRLQQKQQHPEKG